MLKELYDFKQELERHHTFFCFSGPISQDLIAEIGNTLERKMRLDKANKATVFRVFSMLIEEAQNVVHYSDEKFNVEETDAPDPELSLGVLAVGYEDGHYFVSCGNVVENGKVEKLEEKLLKLKNMDKNELKEYYKAQRRKGPDEQSKGAGLGFIEMAKKASKPLQFYFKRIDDRHSFFSIKTII